MSFVESDIPHKYGTLSTFCVPKDIPKGREVFGFQLMLPPPPPAPTFSLSGCAKRLWPALP